MRVTLGEPTLEQLGERLAEEVRKAIVGSVDRAGRDVRVPLGEGTEVMGAMWGRLRACARSSSPERGAP